MLRSSYCSKYKWKEGLQGRGKEELLAGKILLSGRFWDEVGKPCKRECNVRALMDGPQFEVANISKI